METAKIISLVRLVVEDLICSGVEPKTLEQQIFGPLDGERRGRISPGTGKDRGEFWLPDEGVRVCLNPVERTLFRLFLAHPEGIPADGLPLHWQELVEIYAEESCFDDKPLRDNAMLSLCAESKTVFYATVSRIKKKFVAVTGKRSAEAYIICRDAHGVYRTRAMLIRPDGVPEPTPTRPSALPAGSGADGR